LNNHTIGRLVYDNGFVLAATSRGLFRHSATALNGSWTPVLDAGVGLPSVCVQSGGVDGTAFVSDVAVKPGTGGNVVDAVVGWRAGSNCNGFFRSTNGSQTFNRLACERFDQRQGLGPRRSPGRRTARKVYALIQSAAMFNQFQADLGGTSLQGIYESDPGSFARSVDEVADVRNLQNGTGSALGHGSGAITPAFGPGTTSSSPSTPRANVFSGSRSFRVDEWWSRPGGLPGPTGTSALPCA
jgi:hypothetical protein